MKLLMLGDITGEAAINHLKQKLPAFRHENKIDLVIANVENAGFISGPSPEGAARILDAGVDMMTGGNHIFQNYDLWPYLEDSDKIVRPVNYPGATPGHGYAYADLCGYRLLVISAMGRTHIEPALDCPFRAVDRVLELEAGRFDYAFLDFHAEATAEKKAIGYYFDGRLSAVVGTHTHVPTADETVLPGGTAYITDVGMCGPTDGVLGVDRDLIIRRFTERLPLKQIPAAGPVAANGVMIELGGKGATSIRRCEF